MNTRQDLLDAIRRNREDDLPRLMFADYLEGEADPREPERAEFVRVSVNAGVEGENGWTMLPQVHNKNPTVFRIPELLDGGYHYQRGFLRLVQCPWEWWSKHAARILPEHPGLERVVLTTWPRYEEYPGDGSYARLVGHQKIESLGCIVGDSTPRRLIEKLLVAEWGGDPKNGGWGVAFELPRERQRGRYVLSVGEPVGSDAEGRAVPAAVGRTAPLGMVEAIRPLQHVHVRLYNAWGGLTNDNREVEIGFLPDDPDAHGGQYRHWEPGMRYRHTPEGADIERRARDLVRRMAEEFAGQDAAAVERILRDLLREHGVTEDDLRAGRRQVTRLTTTDGRPPTVMMCECQRTPISDLLREPGESLEEIMNRRIEVLELRDRRWRLGGPSERNRRYYRVADGICPRCQRLYFAVTREERR